MTTKVNMNRPLTNREEGDLQTFRRASVDLENDKIRMNPEKLNLNLRKDITGFFNKENI